MVKILLRKDFKHEVSLPTPHNGEEVRKWCSVNRMPFVYSTYNCGKPNSTIEYIFADESDAAMFALRWP